ncbi:MAG TPA: PEP-CTERM sorting domain-containing protein [Phycisphaerae bacterium]|nr:PEP-CTERM sorting domain-containing protein [Phycisphaerae bacterium]
MKFAAAFMLAAVVTAPAFGAIQAAGTLSNKVVPGGYEYDLTLQNTGTTNIGSIWFAWIPGYDFLPSSPSAITAPTGWTHNVIPPSFSGDGYSIQWIASAPLANGQSLPGFSFTTTEPPSIVNGASPIFFGIYQTRQTFAYIGGLELDPGTAFLPTVVVPEPASMSLLWAAAATLLLRRRKSANLAAN